MLFINYAEGNELEQINAHQAKDHAALTVKFRHFSYKKSILNYTFAGTSGRLYENML